MMPSEQQQIFTTVSQPHTYQGTLRNTYGVNKVSAFYSYKKKDAKPAFRTT